MIRFYVWTKGRALLMLGAFAAVVALVVLGIVALASPSALPPDRGGEVAVFAESSLLMEASPAAAPTADAAPSPSPSSFGAAEIPITPSPAPDRTLRVEVVRETAAPVDQSTSKRILIYHTHTWEAYQQTESAPYAETEKWRTKDPSANVVAVGTALTASLRALGFTVVHDETAFEPPDLSTAYQRSLTMLEERARLGETYDLYIDLHRDAFSSGAKIQQTVVIGGQDVARFMLLIGKGTGQTGSGYDVRPDWETNYALAERITDSLNAQAEGLCRDINVKTGRFNQHVAPCCVLIECGNNRNTLEEVLRGVPYLAQAIEDSLNAPAASASPAPGETAVPEGA